MSPRSSTAGIGLVLGAAALITGGVAAAAPVAAASSCADVRVTQPDGSILASTQDIDDDGKSDLVEGVPAAADGGRIGAGVVDVHFAVTSRSGPDEVGPPAPRAPQRIGESYLDGVPTAAGDRFGASSTIVDANGDHCADVAVGAPGADSGRGAVVVALGLPTGLSATGAIRIAGPSSGAAFGSAVAGITDDLWVGAPDQTVNGQAQAGAVYHYRLVGGRATLVQTLVQGTFGVAGAPETGDHFGAALAVDGNRSIVIGVPDEDVGSAKDAGLVSVVNTSSTTHLATSAATFTQNTRGLSGVAEAGDHFGTAVSYDGDVLVGVPGEDLGPARDAGMVQVVRVSPAGTVTQQGAITQDSPTVSGVPETGDRFGAAVLWGDFSDRVDDGDEIAVGAPGESLGDVRAAGSVTVLQVVNDFNHNDSLTITQQRPSLYQGAPSTGNLGGTAEAGDAVGATLAAVAYPQWTDTPGGDQFRTGGAALVIDAPGEDVAGTVDAGNVSVVGPPVCRPGCEGTPYAVSYRDSHGAAAGERYGAGSTTVSNGGTEGD